MKKQKKAKASKTGTSSLDLVAALEKLVERLEGLEKKVDLVTGRVSSMPSEIKNFIANHMAGGPRPAPSAPHSNHAPREKVLYEAVCADCQKSCRVPFKPSEGRPIYCPECWAIRKAGHVPKDLTAGIRIPKFQAPATPDSKGAKKSAPSKKAKMKTANKKK